MKLKKWAGNPIVKPVEGSYWEALQVRNPAAIYHDNKVYLLYTAAAEKDYDHFLFFGLALSEDGFNFKRHSNQPILAPSTGEFQGFDAGGLEDARVVKIGDTYYITYCARAVPWHAFHVRGVRRSDVPRTGATWTKNLRRGGLLVSKDMIHFERKGPISSEDVFDANFTLFPQKINGKYVLLHRATPDFPSLSKENKPAIKITFSDNLKIWENDQILIEPAFNWENNKIGAGPPPIKTNEGWLMIYHAVEKQEKNIYRAGLILLDLNDPTKIIARSPYPILEPEEEFELKGTVPTVVFPTGAVVLGDELFVYYGAADTVCCVATVKLKELLDYVLQFRERKYF